jgi:hypothetical protein
MIQAIQVLRFHLLELEKVCPKVLLLTCLIPSVKRFCTILSHQAGLLEITTCKC